MLSVRDEATSCLDAAHRAKLAYIYIRQSTAGQVRQHQESTELQYHLVDRAVALGWPRERVAVIDDDLGKSGTSSTERYGFQRLIGEIRGGRGFSDRGVSGFLPVHYSNRRTEIHEATET